MSFCIILTESLRKAVMCKIYIYCVSSDAVYYRIIDNLCEQSDENNVIKNRRFLNVEYP